MAITLFPDGRILHNGVEVASEKMVDFWAINTDITNSDSDSYIAGSKFTRNDKNAGASTIGTGMSVDSSSGVWTFPTTGKYMVYVTLNNRANNSDNTYLGLKSTTNNSTYVECKRFQSSSSGANGNSHSGSGEYFVNVTDTSQVKIKFYPMSLGSGSYFEGLESDQIVQSSLTFIRMSR